MTPPVSAATIAEAPTAALPASAGFPHPQRDAPASVVPECALPAANQRPGQRTPRTSGTHGTTVHADGSEAPRKRGWCVRHAPHLHRRLLGSLTSHAQTGAHHPTSRIKAMGSRLNIVHFTVPRGCHSAQLPEASTQFACLLTSATTVQG